MAKSDPGKLSYASIGNGTTSHLLMAMLIQRSGTKMNHIPCKGRAQAQTDLIGGQVDMTFDTMVSVNASCKGGHNESTGGEHAVSLQVGTRNPDLE